MNRPRQLAAHRRHHPRTRPRGDGLAACGSSNEAAVRDDGSVDLSKVTLVVGDQKGGSQAC